MNDMSIHDRFLKLWQNKADTVRIFKQAQWGDEETASGERVFCIYPWHLMVIAWDGRVPLCCIDYDVEYEMGNIHNNSLREIWLGESFQRVRNNFLSGLLPTKCRNCTYATGDELLSEWKKESE